MKYLMALMADAEEFVQKVTVCFDLIFAMYGEHVLTVNDTDDDEEYGVK